MRAYELGVSLRMAMKNNWGKSVNGLAQYWNAYSVVGLGFSKQSEY